MDGDGDVVYAKAQHYAIGYISLLGLWRGARFLSGRSAMDQVADRAGRVRHK
jgi:hypothetical protein